MKNISLGLAILLIAAVLGVGLYLAASDQNVSQITTQSTLQTASSSLASVNVFGLASTVGLSTHLS